MKFRQFVGEDKVDEVKKIVQTSIGPTDIDFLKTVLRDTLDGAKAEYYELGFSLSKKNLKRVFDYIKSWFIRYNVPFKPINPYLTLYLLRDINSTQKIIEKIKHSKWNISYNPIGTLTVISNRKDFPPVYPIRPEKRKEYIVLDYSLNNNHVNIMEDFFEKNNINIVHRYCFVKLFEIDSGILTHKNYEDMMYSIPKIPIIKLGNVCFIRR